MKQFEQNAYGGIDVLENGDILVRLSGEELRALYDIQQKRYDVDAVRDLIPDWVDEKTQGDDFFFASFNSSLYSDDEISVDAITLKFFSDDELIQSIAEAYRSNYDNASKWQENPSFEDCMEKAFDQHVSISDLLGEVLYEKHHKELRIGKWRVNVIEKWDSYGEGGNLYHEGDEPLVEFYDMSQDKKVFPNGQFTGGRYYLASLLSSKWGASLADMAKNGTSLELCGGVDAWVVSSGDLAVISAWLKAAQKHCDYVKANDEKIGYSGDVDVPFAKFENYLGDSLIEKGANVIRDRLSAIPEFSDISVEFMGEYIKGYGYSVSFVANVDKDSADALVFYAFDGLGGSFSFEPLSKSLDDTLNEACQRSQFETDGFAAGKCDFKIEK